MRVAPAIKAASRGRFMSSDICLFCFFQSSFLGQKSVNGRWVGKSYNQLWWYISNLSECWQTKTGPQIVGRVKSDQCFEYANVFAEFVKIRLKCYFILQKEKLSKERPDEGKITKIQNWSRWRRCSKMKIMVMAETWNWNITEPPAAAPLGRFTRSGSSFYRRRH